MEKKLPALSTEQRSVLDRIARNSGETFESRSALIASLRRKGYITTQPTVAIEHRAGGITGRVVRVSAIAAFATPEGLARLALKRKAKPAEVCEGCELAMGYCPWCGRDDGIR